MEEPEIPVEVASIEENLKPKSLYDQALEECEKAKPSSDPAYYAKSSCNSCYGRGIEGSISIKQPGINYVNELVCSCARKRYKKWVDNWIKEWFKNHSEAVNSNKVVENTKELETIDNL